MADVNEVVAFTSMAEGTREDYELLERLRNENDRMRELADYRKQLLDDSEWRYQELLQQLKLSQEANLALAWALPPAFPEVAQSEPLPRRRQWWPLTLSWPTSYNRSTLGKQATATRVRADVAPDQA